MTNDDDFEMKICGTVLANRYHLDERIGGGSTAAVFRATDRRTGGAVAVKVLHPDNALEDNEIRRFVQEAQLGAQIRHPNLVRSHDFGGLGGWHFIVMELIEGKSLARCLEAGTFDPGRSASIVLELLAAVGALHDRGIAHRDISPSNVLIESVNGSERVRLADLGLAKKLTERDLVLTDVPHTKPVTPWGTWGYIAPECCTENKKNDYIADIYSVGAVWYKMITGFPPASLADGQRGVWPALVHKLDNLPSAMRAVLLGALAPRAKRYHSAASMAAALRVAMKPRRHRRSSTKPPRPIFAQASGTTSRPPSPIIAQVLTPALAVILLQAWAGLSFVAARAAQLNQPGAQLGQAAQLDQHVEPAAQLDPAEPAALDPQLDAEPTALDPQLDAEPTALPDQGAEPATNPAARPTILAGGSGTRARPRRKSLQDGLRSALATCKSPGVDLEVVLEPGGDVEVNGGAPFGDLGRCVEHEVAKLPPPSKRLAVAL